MQGVAVVADRLTENPAGAWYSMSPVTSAAMIVSPASVSSCPCMIRLASGDSLAPNSANVLRVRVPPNTLV